MFRPMILSLLLAAGTSSSVHAGDTAASPSLEITTIDGKTYNLASQRGHWVVVNFWATWCRPCLKEMPDISQFVSKRQDVSAIGLAFDEIEPAGLKAFVAGHPVSYPIARVDVFKPPADFETPRGLPTTYLIAPDGRVDKRFIGPVTSGDLARAIAESKR